jgi:hypothetical protein
MIRQKKPGTPWPEEEKPPAPSDDAEKPSGSPELTITWYPADGSEPIRGKDK